MMPFTGILRSTRPINLALAALLYGLGAGIARYLGQDLHLAAFLLGLLASLGLHAGSQLLAEVFRLPGRPRQEGETPVQRERNRVRLLQAAFASLTLAGGAALGLLAASRLSIPAGLVLLLMAVLATAYALPSAAGFGELFLAVGLASLLPAFAFLLQAGQLHRLLAAVGFPLTLQAIAWLLAADFPAFASDQKAAHPNLLGRLTWQRAIPLHHLLHLAAFLLYAGMPLVGIPWSLTWPVLLALPFALVQIAWLQRIGQGGRVMWPFFTGLAVGVFGLSAYLLTLTFWTR